MEGTLLKKEMDGCAFALGNEDLLKNVLSRLPAMSFASAACVSKSWSKACNRILYRPKLASALSLSSSLHVAVKEVLDKVLSEPIRPHFAIACVGRNFNLEATHRLIVEKLGSRTPIITNAAAGIIGMDARTDEIKEASWVENVAPNCGIVLVVGFVPGLKVETIPLLGPNKDSISVNKSREPKVAMIENFLMDIKEYTTSVSDRASPDGIIMFGDDCIDMKPVLVEMDNKMSKDTVIVGDASGSFLFKSGDTGRNYLGNSYSFDAVALVFTKDNSSSDVTGKIQFHVTLSTGIIPFGPRLRVDSVSVTRPNCSWLTATVEGYPGILDTWGLLEDISGEIEDKNPNLYIGIRHQKAESSQLGSKSYVAFHKVLGEAGQYYFVVDGVGIKPGDSFIFYHSDSETAHSSSIQASQALGILKTTAAASASSSSDTTTNSNARKKEIIGGLIFSCCSPHGGLFPGYESFPFSINYPGTPVAGVFCAGEIARVSLDDEEEAKEGEDGGGGGGERLTSCGCFLHHDSRVYLAMSFTPPESDDL